MFRARASSRRRRALVLSLLGPVILLWVVEIGVRWAGLMDFPLYVRADSFGYAPRANQAGAFLGKHRWVFNERSLGVADAWRPSARTDVLLIGNSVVHGGNPYAQEDKLAPRLQARLGVACPVWPVAAGGWTTVNALGFLEDNLDLVEGADFFIWQLMPGQMERINPWMRETTHPTQPPLWATGHVLRKLLSERWSAHAPPPFTGAVGLAENHRRFEQMLERLAANRGRSPTGIVVFYPDRNQLAAARRGLEWNGDRLQVQRLASKYGLTVVDVAALPQWTDAMYRDQIHPTTEGNALLATTLARAVLETAPSLGCTGPR